MRGAGLLARQTQALEQAGQAPQAVSHAITPLDMLAEIRQAPCTDPVPLRPGTAQDVCPERGLLTFAQPLGPAWTRLVVETVGSLGMEAQYRIAQARPERRSIPASRAASARVMPSSALAMAKSRRAARRSLSRAARRRRSAGASSWRIWSAAMATPVGIIPDPDKSRPPKPRKPSHNFS